MQKRNVNIFLIIILMSLIILYHNETYAANNLSQAQVKSWLDNEINLKQTRGSGECVDFCNYYLTNCWGLSSIRGNAKTWKNQCPSGWTPVNLNGSFDNCQIGDLLVEDYEPYGHVSVYYGKEAGVHYVVDQNNQNRRYTDKGRIWANFSNPMYCFRPAFSTTPTSFTVSLDQEKSLSGSSFPITGKVINGGTYPWLNLYMDYDEVDQTCNNEVGNYAFYLDTTKYSDGKHLLGVKLRNQDGYDYTAWFNIYINNVNPGSISDKVSYTVNSIEEGSVLRGTKCGIWGYVYGGGTYPWLNLYMDYKEVDQTCNNEVGKYAFYLDTTKYSDGKHLLGVKLRNQDGYDYTTWFNIYINNSNPETVHIHKWDNGKVTKEPTCTETGIRTFTCKDCKDTREEVISAKGHKPVTDKAVAPTTTATGLTEGSHCSVCGAVLKKQEIVPKLNKTAQETSTKKTTKVPTSPSNRDNNKSQGTTGNQIIPVTSLQLSGLSTKIAAGKKIRLSAAVLPENAINKNIVWTTSNKKVATVNQNGVVSVKKKTGGKSVTIKAMATDGSGKMAVWKIKSMKGVVKSIAVKGAKPTLQTGKNLKLKAVVKATKGANKKLKWTSSNPAFATVNAKGVVKALNAGKGKTVKITVMATDGSNKKKVLKIKIK